MSCIAVGGVRMLGNNVSGAPTKLVGSECIAELQIVDTVALPHTGESIVELVYDGNVVAEAEARGHYGLVWIPCPE